MADMTTINATVDGASYTFRLLEADIPTLTFDSPGATLDAFSELIVAMGLSVAGIPTASVEVNQGKPYARRVPGIFRDLVMPKGDGDYRSSTGPTIPTGKALLARAAALISNGGPYPTEVVATLVMALKGGGLDINTAAGIAQNLARSPQSSAGKSYVTNVLVPQILNAAASA